MQNPDPRPLPNGWTQHYDTSRNTWYYVQINVTPPRASHQHPADMGLVNQAGPSGALGAPPPPPSLYSGIPASLQSGQGPQSNGGSGLSLAQRLYASSAKTESTPPLIPASASDLRNLNVPQAPPSRTSMSGISAPPAPVSPPTGLRSSPSLQSIPRENDATYIPTNSADRRTDQPNGSGSSRTDTPVRSDSNIAPPSYALTDDEFSIPDQMNDSQEAPTIQPPPLDRAQSYDVPPPPLRKDNHPNPANDGTASQPPPFQRAQSYQVPPPPPLLGHRTPSYPASSSAHPLSSTGPRSTPQISTMAQPQQTGNSSESTPYRQTTASQPPPCQGMPATGNQPTPQPQAPGGSAVGNSILNSNVVQALLNIFSGSNSGVNQSTLHAVLQGQPGADYQSIISALTLKQQQANMHRFQGFQQTPPVDYQPLINELRLQMISSSQSAATQQASTQQSATQQAFARLAQQTSPHQASSTQQVFANLAQQFAGPSATQQVFAHLAQQAAPQQQQPFAQPPFAQPPFAQPPFAQPPFAQPPFAQPSVAQQLAAQQTEAQQVAALEEQMAALQVYHRLAARGRNNALDLLDDGRYTYVKKRSSNDILDLI